MSRVTSPAFALLIVAAAAVGLAYGLQTTGSSREHGIPAAKVQDGTWSPPALNRRATKGLVWAVGDGPDGGAAAAAVAGQIAKGRPALLLYLGDVYENGTAQEFARRYAPLYGHLAGVTAPTPGNHDWPQSASGYDPYWKKASGKPVPSYYSFNIAGWQIISLNSEIDHGTGSAQYRWLRRHLGGRTTCRLAFWHRPRYSAGLVHGDASDIAPLWNALAGHAALVLSGHEHNSQRLDPRQGIVELVAGAGGHGLYRLDSTYPGLAFADDTHYGALRLRLRRGQARIAFVAANGSILDSSTVRCGP